MVLCTSGVCIVENDGQTMTGTLGEFYVTLDDGFEYQFLEVALHLIVDLVSQSQTTVVHRQQETFNLQLRVQFVLDDLDGVQQFADTLKGEVLTLYRDDDGVGSCQGIDGDEAQRRRTVDEDIVVFLLHRCQHIF